MIFKFLVALFGFVSFEMHIGLDPEVDASVSDLQGMVVHGGQCRVYHRFQLANIEVLCSSLGVFEVVNQSQ